MQQKTRSKSKVKALNSGYYNISEDRIKRVLTVLANMGNVTPHIQGHTAREIGIKAGFGSEGEAAQASAIHALHYLHHFNYIDWGVDVAGNNHFFVRNARWLKLGRPFTYPRLSSGRYYGSPFKWWDYDVNSVNALNVYNGLSSFRMRSGSSSRWIKNHGQKDIAKTAPCLAMSTAEISKALDALNTWGLATQWMEKGLAVPSIELAFFKPLKNGKITYRDPLPERPPFPDSGYLGDVPGVSLEPIAPVVPKVPRREPVESTVDTPTDAPVVIPPAVDQDTTEETKARVDARVDVDKPVLNVENPPSMVWDPNNCSDFMKDMKDFGTEGAIFLMQIEKMTAKFPSHPNGSVLSWVMGPSIFLGDFNGFFPWDDGKTVQLTESFIKMGRLVEVVTSGRRFYRVVDRLEVLP